MIPLFCCQLNEMKTKILLIALFLAGVANAQQGWFLGVEAGYATDRYRFADPGGRLNADPFFSGHYGVVAHKRLPHHFYVEAGIGLKPYLFGISFRDAGASTLSGYRTCQVPLRIGYRLPLVRDRLSLLPVAGYTFSFVVAGDDLFSAEGDAGYTGTDAIHYSYTARFPTKTFSLLQAGIAAEVRLFRTSFLGLSYSYLAGTEKIFVQDISYIVNSGAKQNAQAYTSGGYTSAGISLKIPLQKNKPVVVVRD
ncbi:MAG: hypothetical protein JWP27_1319 [Flaviaesturariibacter sp.]|nr:hypothetical protein [Flaviaesturariibacter sp.]